jgi:hypothetical protein
MAIFFLFAGGRFEKPERSEILTQILAITQQLAAAFICA